MDELSLMTWNVRYFGHGTRGLRATAKGMQRIAAALAAHDGLPQVIALQEVETRSMRGGLHSTTQLERFLDVFNTCLRDQGDPRRYQGHYFPAHRYAVGPAVLYTTGLAVLVVEDVEVQAESVRDITVVRFKGMRRWKQRRIVAHLRLLPPGSGRPIDLFNTHLSLPAFFEVGPHRIPESMGHGSNQITEMDNVLAFAEEQASEHAVLVGDLNSAPGSPVYSRILEAGFHDATPSSAHELGTAGFMSRRMHIDHVFATAGVRWIDLTSHSVDEGPFRGLSDHAPKIGRLVVDPAPNPSE